MKHFLKQDARVSNNLTVDSKGGWSSGINRSTNLMVYRLIQIRIDRFDNLLHSTPSEVDGKVWCVVFEYVIPFELLDI